MVIDSSSKFYNWITFANSSIANVLTDDDWNGAREYYEDIQTPANVPDDKEYIQVDIITDAIDRAVGQVISGNINIALSGGGDMTKPIKELHNDILEANDFYEITLPDQLNKFYCEGMGAFKIVDNPFKVSKYGIGFLEIHGIPIGRELLDSNSRNGMHQDDIYRINKERRLKSYALDKWGRGKNGRKNALYNMIDTSSEENSGTDTEEFVDIYEIEYFETKFFNEEGIRKEKDVYYITKIINQTVQVEPPTKTKYTLNRQQVMIHTPRTSEDVGRMPMGLFKKIKQQQDNINITESVIIDTVKGSVKNLFWSKGLKPDEILEAKREIAKTDGWINTKNANAKIEHFEGQQISPALVQLRTFLHQDKDIITGSSSQAQQFQSAAAGQLSGKAIGSLQFAGILPEYSKKTNIEYTLKQVSRVILEYIGLKMQAPFEIERKIDGSDRMIRYNTQASPDEQGDDYEVIKDGMINPLSNLPKIGITIDIEMNASQQREMEMNKALALSQMSKISDVDLMTAMYPNTWKEKIENLKKQSAAQAIIQESVEVGGEELLNELGQVLESAKQNFKDGEYIGDQLNQGV